MGSVNNTTDRTQLLSQYKATLNDKQKKEFDSLPVDKQISIMNNALDREAAANGATAQQSNSVFGNEVVESTDDYVPDKAPDKVEVLIDGKKRFVSETENPDGTITSSIYAEDGITLLSKTIFAKVENGSWDRPIRKLEYSENGEKTLTNYGPDGKTIISEQRYDKNGKKIVESTDYVVQNGESIPDLIKKSLAAQGITNPTKEQIAEATKEFEAANKGKIHTAPNGTKYLMVGETVKLKGDVDTSKNKSANETINDYAKNEVASAEKRIGKYEGKTKEIATKPGDSYYSIAKQCLKNNGIENPTQAQIVEMQNDLMALNNNKKLAPNDKIIVPKTGAEVSAETTEVADAKKTEAETAKKSANAKAEGTAIADGLYDAMDGIATKYQPFKNNIDKINSKNVIETIEAYRNKSKDESLIEAIADEKGMQLNIRIGAINQIKDAIVQRAKEAGINSADFESKFNAELQKQKDGWGPMDMEKLDIMLESFIEQIHTAESVKNEKISDKANGTNNAQQRENVSKDDAQKAAIGILKEKLNEAKAAFKKGVDGDGWAGKTADFVSQAWGSKNRAELVEGDLQKYEAQINRLEKAAAGELKDANGKPITFEQAYKEEFGVEFNKDNLISYANAEEEYKMASIADETYKMFDGALSPHVEKFDEAKGAFNKKNLSELEASLKSVLGENGVEKIFKEQNIDIASMSDEQKYNVLVEYSRTLVASSKDDASNSLGGKSIEELKLKNDRSYTAAFGTENDMNKRVTDYVSSQAMGTAVTKGAVVVAAVAVTVGTMGAGSPALVAALGATGAQVAVGAVATAGVSAAVEISDRATNNIDNAQDLSPEQILEITKNAVIDGGIYAASFGLMKMIPGISSKNALAIAKQAAKEAGIDAGIGVAGDYAKNGEVTAEGVAYNLILSAAGATAGMRGAAKKRPGMHDQAPNHKTKAPDAPNTKAPDGGAHPLQEKAPTSPDQATTGSAGKENGAQGKSAEKTGNTEQQGPNKSQEPQDANTTEKSRNAEANEANNAQNAEKASETQRPQEPNNTNEANNAQKPDDANSAQNKSSQASEAEIRKAKADIETLKTQEKGLEYSIQRIKKQINQIKNRVISPQEEAAMRKLFEMPDDVPFTAENVKKAYKKMSKKLHTDKNPGSDEAFKDMKNKYEQLDEYFNKETAIKNKTEDLKNIETELAKTKADIQKTQDIIDNKTNSASGADKAQRPQEPNASESAHNAQNAQRARAEHQAKVNKFGEELSDNINKMKNGDEIIFGRETNDVFSTAENHMKNSRKQVRVTNKDGQFYIENMGQNPILINGVEVKPGKVYKMGMGDKKITMPDGTTFEFKVPESKGPSASSESSNARGAQNHHSARNVSDLQDVKLGKNEPVVVAPDSKIRLANAVDIDLADFKSKIASMKDGDSFIIGRNVRGANDIQINNNYVSGQHLKIEKIDGKIVVTDLSSTNGTVINTTQPDYAAKFDPNVRNKFGNHRYNDFERLYNKNYDDLRMANYSRESSLGTKSEYFDRVFENGYDTKLKGSGMGVMDKNGWCWRQFDNGMNRNNVVDRISLNVKADKRMIDELDKLMMKGEYVNAQGKKIKLSDAAFTKGYYKTPKNTSDWLTRHDPITMYFDDNVSPEMLNAIAEITQKYARTPSNGKALMNSVEGKPWMAHEAYTPPAKIQALYEEAKLLNPELAQLIYSEANSHGSWNVSTGQYAALEKVVNEYKLASPVNRSN